MDTPVAFVLQGKFAKWRVDQKYDPYLDIRKNLIKPKVPDNKQSTYHAYYLITRLYTTAKSEIDFNKLSVVCVECQAFVLKNRNKNKCKGDGILWQKSKFYHALGNYRGYWTKVTQNLNGKCISGNTNTLIFI